MAKKQQLSMDEKLEQALVKLEEQAYAVPGNWVWTKIGVVCKVNPTKINTKDYEDSFEVTFIPMAAISEVVGNIQNYEVRAISSVKSGYTNFVEDDILFAKITPCMENGKSAIATGLRNNIGYGSTEFHVLRATKCVINKFVFYLLRCEEFRKKAKKRMSGSVGQQRVPREYMESYCIAIPPRAEQLRIVATIESLFAKLDRAKELVQASLESFAERKAAILHQAFSGELTRKWREEKNPVDSPETIFEIIEEQRRLFCKNKKEDAELTELFSCTCKAKCREDNGWIKISAKMFCDTITSGKTPTGNINEKGDIPFLKVYNIVENNVSFSYKAQYIDKDTHSNKLKSSILKPGDVIMNIVGPPLRKIAIIPDDYPEWNMNQAIVRFRTVHYVSHKYLYYCLLNEETLRDVIVATKGVVGQANISITQSRNLMIPIPSCQEQQEIVRTLDELLEQESKAAELADALQQIDQLKQTILAKAFRGELGTNDPAEESALELLKSVLQEN